MVLVPKPHTAPTDCSHKHAPLETLKLAGWVKGVDRRTLPALDWSLWQYRSALFACRFIVRVPVGKASDLIQKPMLNVFQIEPLRALSFLSKKYCTRSKELLHMVTASSQL